MKYIVSILIIISVVLFNILYLFQDQSFFDRQFQDLGSYERQESVMDEAMILMQYRKNTDTLVDSDVYMQAEKEHLYDVKQLLYGMEYVFVLCLFFFLLGFRYFNLRVFSKVLLFAFVLGVGLGLVSWLARDRLFVQFHLLFFSGNWMFPADSFLIQSYPWDFFRNAMVVICLRSFFVLFMVLGVKRIYNKFQRH